jgi:hypothetical protein
MYDYFVAELRCPRCGTVNSATANINMQTHIRDDADGSSLAVGYLFDPVDLKTENVLSSGYALVSPPAVAGTLRLLDTWTCPACETEQWAAVEIVNGRIERIEAVPMNRATLEATNFISDVNAELLAAALMDMPPAEWAKLKLNSIDVLRQRLA